MARCSGSDVRHGEECAARPAKRRVVTAYLGFPSSLADPLAQPRVRPAKYLISKPSAAPPGGFSGYYRIAFYNISSSDEPYHMDGLATEISQMVHDTCADAVGIGGMSSALQAADVLNINYTESMLRVLYQLNISAKQPAWEGLSDGHYIFVWKSERLLCTFYEYTSCGIEEQPWRMAQYLQFQRADAESGPPLHVCHCHSPSNNVLQLDDSRRERTFKSLWSHVMINNPVDNLNISDELPVAIFGGDFDCTSEQWLLCLKKEEATQASRRNVQVAGGSVLSHRVVVFNAFAAQEDSGWKSQSDDDVVLVSLCWRLHTQAKTARPVVPKVTAAHTGSWPRRSNTANGSE